MRKAILGLLISAVSIIGISAGYAAEGTYQFKPFGYFASMLNSQTITINVKGGADLTFNEIKFNVRSSKGEIAKYSDAISKAGVYGAQLKNIQFAQEAAGEFYDIAVYTITADVVSYSGKDLSLANPIVISQWPLYNSQSKVSVNGVPVYTSMPYNISLCGVKSAGQDAQDINLVNADKGTKSNPTPGKYIAGYFTDWANYHYNGSTPSFNPDDILKTYVNTVYYAIVNANPQGDVSMIDAWADGTYVPGFAQLRENYPYINVLLSFGGWGDETAGTHPSGDIEKILNSSKTTDTFAKHAVETMYLYGFNGVDVDWEWWGAVGTTGSLNKTTAANFVALFSDLNKYVNQLAEVTGNDRDDYLVTMAGPAGKGNIDELEQYVAGGWEQIAEKSDLVNPMTYDMHGLFDKSGAPADHQSRLEKTSIPGSNPDFCGAVALSLYNSYNVPYKKMLIGLAAYCRIVGVGPAKSETKNLGAPLTGAVPAGCNGLGGGIFSYKAILGAANKIPTNYACSLENGLANLNIKYVTLADADEIDSSVVAPWAYSDNSFMSFDDHDSAKAKSKWVAAKGMPGAFIWEIDCDLPPTDSN